MNLSTKLGYNILMSRPKGFKHSQTTIDKIRQSNLGKKRTEDVRHKLSLTHIGLVSPKKNQIPLMCQFCGGSYTRSLSASKSSKYCSVKCGNTVKGRLQVKYPSELLKILKVYREMVRRCTSSISPAYKNYGGRGIKVCDEWLDVNIFLADMLPSYVSGLTLDRIDNDGNYEPSNCRWATYKEQSLNRRTTQLITYDGRTMTLPDWARFLSVPSSRLSMRFYKYKWPVERVLS